MDQNIYIE